MTLGVSCFAPVASGYQCTGLRLGAGAGGLGVCPYWPQEKGLALGVSVFGAIEKFAQLPTGLAWLGQTWRGLARLCEAKPSEVSPGLARRG